MCGQAGIILGRKRRTSKEVSDVADLFEHLLLLSERRGRYATGTVWLKADGSFSITKAPMPATLFVASEDYARWRLHINTRTAILMGHTRYPTGGSHLINANNQPLVSPGECPVILTHNGRIPHVGRLFKRFRLPRTLEVDSEILLKLAARHLGASGISFHRLMTDIAACPGYIAAVIVTPRNPDSILFIRRERPMCFARHPGLRLLAYASELSILEEALHDWPGWRFKTLSPCRGVIIDRTDVNRLSPFSLDDFSL